MLERLGSAIHSHRRTGALSLIAASLLAGVILVTPAIGLSAGSHTAMQTRAVSCWASGFHPLDSGTSYVIGGSNALYRNAPGGGSGFRCDLALPHRAVVTRVQFTSLDYQTDGEVGACVLARFSLVPSTVSAFTAMASVSGTGYAATPGTIRKTDTTINHATVDNVNFAYVLQCDLGASGPNAGLYGGSVTYTITATNG